MDVVKFTKDNAVILGVIVAIILGSVALYFAYHKTDGFKSLKNMVSKPSLKELDVVMFYDPSCPNCVNMMEVLKKENKQGDLTMIDVSQKEGMEMAQKVGVDQLGVPSYISRKLNTATVGAKNSVNDLINELVEASAQAKQEKESIKNNDTTDLSQVVADLQITLFSSDSCGFCKKAKKDCEDRGLVGIVRIVDIGKQEGQELLKQAVENSEGEYDGSIPVYHSSKKGKYVTGFTEMPELVKLFE